MLVSRAAGLVHHAAAYRHGQLVLGGRYADVAATASARMAVGALWQAAVEGARQGWDWLR